MYDPHVNGETLNFAISGLLYQSTVLLYDRQTNSLWSQMSASAISGRHAGRRLKKLPHTDTNWGAWRRMHPDTLVMDRNTGHQRPYGQDPYSGTIADMERTGPLFPVNHRDQRLPPNMPVIGIELQGQAKAYPLATLRSAPAEFTDTIGGRPVTLRNEPAGTIRSVQGADGTPVAAVRVLWFAWATFHPNTTIYGQTGRMDLPASAPAHP